MASHPFSGEYHEDKQMETSPMATPKTMGEAKRVNGLRHTPAPWILKDGSIVGGPYGQPICELEEWPSGADAALIASAPELLEALKDAQTLLMDLKREFHNETEQHSWIVGWYDKHEEAIAKAEGR